jgi:hypothetical protein
MPFLEWGFNVCPLKGKLQQLGSGEIAGIKHGMVLGLRSYQGKQVLIK